MLLFVITIPINMTVTAKTTIGMTVTKVVCTCTYNDDKKGAETVVRTTIISTYADNEKFKNGKNMRGLPTRIITAIVASY